MKIDSIEQFIELRNNLNYPVSGKRKIEIPCYQTLLVKRDLIVANNYNPNSVPKEKMELLKESIVNNGFCFPIVTIFDYEQEKFVIIDGFHRWIMSSEKYLNMDYVPLVCLKHDITQRMTATWQFNKARGFHSVELDSDLIKGLIEQGLNDLEISKKLGIDIETVARYKSLTGIVELFKNVNYSSSWEIGELNNDE